MHVPTDRLFARFLTWIIATITAHHLYLTSTEACCDPFAFCKPIPKKPTDRHALLKAVVSGNSKFFLYVVTNNRFSVPLHLNLY